MSQKRSCPSFGTNTRIQTHKSRCAQELSAANREARLARSKRLLKKYSNSDVDFMWFTDEKIFTITTPKNPQNDRLYAPTASKKREIAPERLLRTRSMMVSFSMSNLGQTQLIFVDPAVKINGAYYRDHDVLLTQQLLPVVQEILRDFFVLQQDSAPAHRATTQSKFLNETPAFIAVHWPRPDRNPVDYKI